MELFKEFSDQTTFILKNKNILFFHELQNLLLDLKKIFGERNSEEFQKIENFIQKNLNLIFLENENLSKYLEKINLFDLPSKDPNNNVDDLMRRYKAELENNKIQIDSLNKKNMNLEAYVNGLLNNPENELNSGLKKTIQKLIALERKNEYLESKQENFIKQIYLLKEENLKLFVFL